MNRKVLEEGDPNGPTVQVGSYVKCLWKISQIGSGMGLSQSGTFDQ